MEPINSALRYAALAAALLVAACGDGDKPAAPAERSTWEVVHQDILVPRCTSCHQQGTSFARQSGLELDGKDAYEQLVGALPTNAAARADGLLRVSAEGLGGVERSFLWEKINVYDQEHFYADHPHYGALMPLGGEPLSDGELEFIRRWIASGAPRQGQVADRALLENENRYSRPEFAPLAVPEKGMQLHLGPFEVPPRFEREFFYYAPLENDEPLFVRRFEVSMREGSHHFLLYTFRDELPDDLVPASQVYRELRDRQGKYLSENFQVMLFHLPVIGSQWPFLDYHFPPGVALRLPPRARLDLNSHYINRRDEVYEGEVYLNLHLADPGQVVHEARIFGLSNFDIRLPPGKVTTLKKDFYFSERRHILQLVSHAHEHMVEFRALILGGARDGELVYVSRDWEHPPVLELDPPLVLERGQGLRLQATYDNWTRRELNFGFLSEDEMMILYGFYYAE